MEGTTQDVPIVALSRSEEDEHINNEIVTDEVKPQVMDEDGNDSHILPQSISNQSYVNSLPMPMVISIQSNTNRNDILPQSMSGMVTPQIRNAYYPQQIMNSYPFANSTSLSYGNDISNGTGSIALAPVNSISAIGQPSSLPVSSFSNQEMRLHDINPDNNRVVNNYYMNLYYLKPSEEQSLANCLLSLGAENLQVPHSYIIKLLGELFNDDERSSISKDENQLHQYLLVFLQQRKDIAMRNIVIPEDAEPSKTIADFSHFSNLFHQYMSSTNGTDLNLTSDSKDPMKNTAIPPQDINWVSQTRSYSGDQSFSSPKSNRTTHPGKPTVLTHDEETLLAYYILLLEGGGMRVTREDVGTIVMKMVSVLGRQHPFKEGGPHRHWFNGFHKRNPSIMRNRKSTASAKREKLSDKNIDSFVNVIKYLHDEDRIGYVAHNLHLAKLDEQGFHVDLNQDSAINNVPVFLQNSQMIPSTNVLLNDQGMKEDKPKRKSWTEDQLSWAIQEVTQHHVPIKEVSQRTNIPPATIRNHCKNPQMGARRGPPTVLTQLEEDALEKFLIELDNCGYRASKEQLGKLIMEVVKDRQHPFKEDGPHRHWYDGYYRRHALLHARKRAGNSSLSRQEAPEEKMNRFFEILKDMKSQSGEKKESDVKRIKLSTNMEFMETERQGTTISLDGINTNGIETDMTEGTEMNALSTRKGGRPKQPLFTVQVGRQKKRTEKVMDFIRKFASENQENVDDILWSLLLLRVKGSENKEISEALKQLYDRWSEYTMASPRHTAPLSTVISQVMQNPIPTIPATTQISQLPPDIVQMQQQNMHPNENDYSMAQMTMEGPSIMEADQNDIITRV